METYSLKDSNNIPLDIKLLPYLLNIKDKGFFVEAGANDGITQSNTFLLEKKYGWNGLLIEPSKISFEKCIQNRSNKNIFENCALVSDDNIKTVVGDFNNNISNGLMCSIDGKRLNNKNLVNVESFTLNHLIKKHNIKEIDFMSLDVEGFELDVLKGIDLSSKWSPKIFLIEIYNKDIENIFNILEPYYNDIGNFSNYNKINNPYWDGTHNDYLFIKKNI